MANLDNGVLISTTSDYNGPLIANTRDLTGSLLASENSYSSATSPTTKQAISNYMGYGSYSGADIKMIVHFPKTNIAMEEAEKERRRITDELAYYTDIVNRYSSDPVLTEDGNRIIASLNEELEKTEETIEKARNLPTSKTLAEVHTVSWSTHRSKNPFRPLGSVYPKTINRGSRTIAGTMIFTLFHKHALHELLELNLGIYSTGTSDHDSYKNTTNLLDQLPPLDFSFVFANEYGAVSHMGLYGVEFVQEGSTFSIEDIYSESVVQYMARDIDPIRVAGTRKIDNRGVTNVWTKDASGLMYEQQSTSDYLKRRNPFI